MTNPNRAGLSLMVTGISYLCRPQNWGDKPLDLQVTG